MEPIKPQFIANLRGLDEAILARETEKVRLLGQFLARLGYIEPVEGAFRATVSEERGFSKALEDFQRFYSLEPSGVLNRDTLEIIEHPRCGCRDIRAIALGRIGPCAWDERRLTYSFANTCQDVIPTSRASDAVRRAFKSWEDLGKVTFEERASGEVHIEIRWTSAEENDFSLVGDAIAHADFPGACAVVTRSLPKPVHFDDGGHFWAIGAVLEAFDIETVALHEIGHILGLEHSQNRLAVMYPLFRGEQIKRNLIDEDKDAFHALYP